MWNVERETWNVKRETWIRESQLCELSKVEMPVSVTCPVSSHASSSGSAAIPRPLTGPAGLSSPISLLKSEIVYARNTLAAFLLLLTKFCQLWCGFSSFFGVRKVGKAFAWSRHGDDVRTVPASWQQRHARDSVGGASDHRWIFFRTPTLGRCIQRWQECSVIHNASEPIRTHYPHPGHDKCIYIRQQLIYRNMTCILWE